MKEVSFCLWVFPLEVEGHCLLNYFSFFFMVPGASSVYPLWRPCCELLCLTVLCICCAILVWSSLRQLCYVFLVLFLGIFI